MKTELEEVKFKVTEKSTQNEEVSVEVTVKEGLKELDDTIEELNVEIPKLVAMNEVLVRQQESSMEACKT
jgi:predicted nuclease with TOPRIM domain|tara:strand:+ start:940 stop:1149 length:210 start_codon:yes stop_codon:yes gene_type:complete